MKLNTFFCILPFVVWLLVKHQEVLSFIAVASLCLESTAKREQLELTRIWKHRVCEQKKGNWANVVINDYLHYQLICPLSYSSTKCQNILKYAPQNLPEPKVTSSNSFYCPTTSEKPEKQQKSWRFSECLTCLLKEISKTTNLVSQKLPIHFFLSWQSMNQLIMAALHAAGFADFIYSSCVKEDF